MPHRTDVPGWLITRADCSPMPSLAWCSACWVAGSRWPVGSEPSQWLPVCCCWSGGGVASRLSLDAWLVRSVSWVKALFRLGMGRKTIGSLMFLGMVNGFLPCGLVYAAGISAAASGNPLSGALSMVVFGLGTLPLLLVVDRLGQRLGATSRARFQKAVPWVVAGVGVLLIVRGLALGIPYLSPSSEGACPHCEG